MVLFGFWIILEVVLGVGFVWGFLKNEGAFVCLNFCHFFHLLTMCFPIFFQAGIEACRYVFSGWHINLFLHILLNKLIL